MATTNYHGLIISYKEGEEGRLILTSVLEILTILCMFSCAATYDMDQSKEQAPFKREHRSQEEATRWRIIKHTLWDTGKINRAYPLLKVIIVKPYK